jgi:hypothetical protein
MTNSMVSVVMPASMIRPVSRWRSPSRGRRGSPDHAAIWAQGRQRRPPWQLSAIDVGPASAVGAMVASIASLPAGPEIAQIRRHRPVHRHPRQRLPRRLLPPVRPGVCTDDAAAGGHHVRPRTRHRHVIGSAAQVGSGQPRLKDVCGTVCGFSALLARTLSMGQNPRWADVTARRRHARSDHNVAARAARQREVIMRDCRCSWEQCRFLH